MIIAVAKHNVVPRVLSLKIILTTVTLVSPGQDSYISRSYDVYLYLIEARNLLRYFAQTKIPSHFAHSLAVKIS